MATTELDLAIGGMTCASCAARIERKLNKLDGVAASVNLATEKAHVSHPDTITPDQVIATVEKLGYQASPLSRPTRTAGGAVGGPGSPDAPGGVSDVPGVADAAPDPALTVAPGRSTQETLRRRAMIAAAFTVPVVVMAMIPPIGHALGAARPWLELIFTLPVVIWAAYPFHRAALINARHLASTMDTLVSLGVTAAFGWSLAATLAGSTGHLYYEVAAVVTTFLLVGRYAEARAKMRGRSALTSLLELGAKDVAVLREEADAEGEGRGARDREVELRVPIEQLRVGDRFVVRPGEKVATDGLVLEGISAVDASLVTGESMPVDVRPGDTVTGGTVNAHGRLIVRAQRVGVDTVLAGMTRLVETAQTGKAPVQRLADRVSAVFVPLVLLLAVATFAGWLLTGNEASAALSAAVTVLVIACPCALGLATPTALLVGTGRGAELGVFIKGPQILESTRTVDTVLFDKTGTLTMGAPKLIHIATAGRLRGTAALQAAASVEAASEHPIARAIVGAARDRAIPVKPVSDFVSLPGSGARASIQGTEVTVGRPDLFDHVPAEIRLGERVGTTVYVGWGGTARAALTVADEIRPRAAASIDRLRRLGLTAHLLTGDNERTAADVARQVGIHPGDVTAQVRPEDKHAVVEHLQARGHVVAMVGDGVNDAAALAAADLGMAMGSGTDVAIDSADIVLMRTEVAAVADAIALSRQTLRIIKQNLAWAFGYNILALPLAVSGRLSPMIAGGAMAASSVLVVMNSLRLRNWQPAGSDEPEEPDEPGHPRERADRLDRAGGSDRFDADAARPVLGHPTWS